jgi:hypothetical protein
LAQGEHERNSFIQLPLATAATAKANWFARALLRIGSIFYDKWHQEPGVSKPCCVR